MEVIKKYAGHKSSAKQRGIAWEFDFHDWMTVWDKSGKFSQRGRKVGQYVMARFGDVGPYSVDNVKIILCSENLREAIHRGRRMTTLSEGQIDGLRLAMKLHVVEMLHRCSSAGFLTNRAIRKQERERRRLQDIHPEWPHKDGRPLLDFAPQQESMAA